MISGDAGGRLLLPLPAAAALPRLILPGEGRRDPDLLTPRVPPFPRNQAAREPDPGFWARARDFLGVRSLPPSIAAVGQAVSFGLGAEPARGAPLLGEQLLDPRSFSLRMRTDLSALASGAFPRGFFGRHGPQDLAAIDVAISLGFGPPRARSLREAIHLSLSGQERQTAIAALDLALAHLRRAPGQALHDLVQDPSGLHGPALDGRLPATVDKILELRRLRRISRADLVNRHEVTAGNEVQVLPGGARAFESILRDIGEAKESVHLAFFIVMEGQRCDQLVDALVRKAQKGVPVRIILDERGQLLAGQLHFERLVDRLRKGGVEVEVNWIVPGQGERVRLAGADHRKEVVIDGRVAYTGGINVGDDYLDVWHDVAIRVEGPSALQVQAEWMLTWLALGGEIDPRLDDDGIRAKYFPLPRATSGGARLKIAGTIPGESEEIRLATIQLIREAQETIDIENPYLTSAEVQRELLAAALRGVKVRLLIPAENNHKYCCQVARTHFPALLAAGAEIREIPGMAHGKVLVVDGRRGWIGTSNLDDLSLRKIHELDVLFDDAAVGASARRLIFEPDVARSRLLRREDITAKDLALGHLWSLLRQHI